MGQLASEFDVLTTHYAFLRSTVFLCCKVSSSGPQFVDLGAGEFPVVRCTDIEPWVEIGFWVGRFREPLNHGRSWYAVPHPPMDPSMRFVLMAKAIYSPAKRDLLIVRIVRPTLKFEGGSTLA